MSDESIPSFNPPAGATGSSNSASSTPALSIRLDQFLQGCGVPTGGQAKRLIQSGEVLVNDEVETRRRKKLVIGDEVTLGDDVFVVALDEDPEEEPGELETGGDHGNHDAPNGPSLDAD